MATTKKEKRNLTQTEHKRLFDHIGKARVMAHKMSKDSRYTAEVRRALAGVEKKLWNLGNDYRWGSMVD